MPAKNGRSGWCFVAFAVLLGSASAQSSKSIVGIHDLEPGLVHPTILPRLHEHSRKLEGVDLALNPALPFRVKLTPGKRSREFLIEAEPKVGISRLILPGLINAKLSYPSRREKAVRFEVWESRDSLWLCNHCGSLATIAGYEIWFIDMDHDGVLGEVTDTYVMKPPKEKYWADAEERVQFRTMSDPLVIDRKQHWLQPDGRGFSLVVTDKMPDYSKQRDENYEQALKLLNGWRQQLGHPPVLLREDLSRACEEHALYCATNDELTHHQDPKKPGATPKGQKAGVSSELVTATTMEAGLRIWRDSFFHRIRMLSPGLKKVGMGNMHDVAVLDTLTEYSDGGAIWHWPTAGATDVPVSWPAGEDPSPLGAVVFTGALARQWGYPITVTFPSDAVRDAKVKVTMGGAELPAFLTSPEAPSNVKFPSNANSILVMTRAPLPSGSKIEVQATCQFAGKPWTKSWHFTTQAL